MDVHVGSEEIQAATNHFWNADSVRAGKQMDGYAQLIEDILLRNGIPKRGVYHNREAKLPGYFRPTKNWDIAVVTEGRVVAAIELKSQAKSFGKNLNNRTEEVIGSSHDLRHASKEVLDQEVKPWIGYLMLMVDNKKSRESRNLRQPHLGADEAFDGASYARRYELLCERMMQKGIVDGGAFILTEGYGHVAEPNSDINFLSFARGLVAHIRSV
jgi:hypothetical protein